MDYYTLNVESVLKLLNTSASFGLNKITVDKNAKKYGQNVLKKNKSKSLFSRIISALFEPMMIILLISLIITFGANLGKYLKTGDGDFTECYGILLAIILSVSINIIMEGSSIKAFNALNKIYDNLSVIVIRDGVEQIISQKDVVVGDIIPLNSGDKIVADGRLIKSEFLSVDESALTGESVASKKNADAVFNKGVPLAERINSVYSGTFVSQGQGVMVVTGVGNDTEIGKIAGELSSKNNDVSPLNQKLSKLGKTITVVGLITAIAVFILSVIRLSILNEISFDSVRELALSSIVLIVAAIPEGLPTIVAVSLAINMTKLAKENALIKKMTATETAGAVSVICSDKTGTLTQNKMSVVSVYENGRVINPDKISSEHLINNYLLNSTVKELTVHGKKTYSGNATECALIKSLPLKIINNADDIKAKCEVISSVPFSSDRKMMSVVLRKESGFVEYLKGAPEKILALCNLSSLQKEKIIFEMDNFRNKSGRVICFAHKTYEIEEEPERLGFIFDGFAVIVDPVRKEVLKAIEDCRRAKVDIKILTGDNFNTAFAVAKELKIASSKSQVINATDIERLDDEALKKVLPKISVISRSTPLTKLRVVRALKSMGEVVAVTGDGVNDAPAIKHADVGISMGSGSEITKEAADIILLDDSFATVVKTVSFGRNVYRNLQRFILFQLSVNLTAMLFVFVCAVLGFDSPFNTLQLLWINVIMDGPPALTLGLESASDKLMDIKPVKRTKSIVSLKMLFRIIVGGAIMGGIITAQFLTNFLNVAESEKESAVFTLFVLMQLFNAFNCRMFGAESIFGSIKKNKIMAITFIGVFMVHIFIVQVCPNIFAISSMCFSSWFKCILVSSSIIVVSEIYKLIYRLIKLKNNCLKP